MSSTASPGGGGQGTATGGGSRGGEPRSTCKHKRLFSPIDVKVVNCRPCGGCCGHGYIGVPVDLYDRLKVIQGALEEAYPGQYRAFCKVVNLLGDVLCPALNYVPRRPLRLKEVERLVSRGILYKARYALSRLRDADDPRMAYAFLVLGLWDWFNSVHRFLGVQPRLDRVEYVRHLFSGLNHGNYYEVAWLINRLLNSELVEVDYKPGSKADIAVIRLQVAVRRRVVVTCGDLPQSLWPSFNCLYPGQVLVERDYPFPLVVKGSMPFPSAVVRLWTYLNLLGIRRIEDWYRCVDENGLVDECRPRY